MFSITKLNIYADNICFTDTSNVFPNHHIFAYNTYTYLHALQKDLLVHVYGIPNKLSTEIKQRYIELHMVMQKHMLIT